MAMAATGGPGGQPEALTRREVLLSVVCGAVPILPAHRGGHLPRGICRAPVRTRGPLVQDPCVSPGARPQLLPWVGPSAPPATLVGRPTRLLLPDTLSWPDGGPQCGRLSFALNSLPSGTWGELGDSSHPCPPWTAVSCHQNWWGRRRTGGSLAPARRPARLRPFAKLNYHGHGLGDKKLKTKDFKITSFQVGENGPWLGPRSHVPNSEVWVSRNADK